VTSAGHVSGKPGEHGFSQTVPDSGNAGRRRMALYLLVAIVVGLVIYLFYAVIHPEKF
jgi:K+-transporting ATPase KdpF subunit